MRNHICTAERRTWFAPLTVLLVCAAICSTSAFAQSNTSQNNASTTVHGRVLNSVTKEPVARALVVTAGDDAAAMTDDRGQFELKIATPEAGRNVVASRPGVSFGTARIRGAFQVRKPGFVPGGHNSMQPFSNGEEITLYLTPEALIIGYVTVPGSEGDVRIQCQLYAHGMREGQETWTPSQMFLTWADGEVRFSDLKVGTYKLVTHEQIDRETLQPVPGAQMFGYPPIYYPNTTDFSLAAPIVVHAGETVEVNLTVTRRPYYPVRIPVLNAPASPAMNMTVYPMGHHGPGWSLGYNPMEQAIMGMLPDGHYTVEADSMSEVQSTGIMNFSVQGAPFEGQPLNLVPNPTVTVNIREEAASGQNAAEEGMATPNGVVSLRGQHSFVTLDPMGELNARGRLVARPANGQDFHSLVFENVRPGQYRVNVMAVAGYTAAIESGGRDVMKQPLVVGNGGAVSPIEITLRGDGAEVSGTVEEEDASGNSQQSENDAKTRFVYLLPTGEGIAQMKQAPTSRDGAFRIEQVPPGDYLAVAFEEPQQDLSYGSEEALRGLVTKGQKIHVEAGQKLSLKVKVIAGSEAE